MGICDAGFKAVAADGLSAVAQLAADFAPFKSAVEAHFQEEEQVGLPLMRANCSAQDFEPTWTKMRAQLAPADLAWLVRTLPDDEARRDWLARVVGVPGVDISRDVMPAVLKYHSDAVAPMRALIDGAKEAPPQGE